MSHGEQIVAVDDDSWNVIGGGALAQEGDCGRSSERAVLPVMVVLDDYEDRQPPDCRQVLAFVEGSDVRRPVTCEGDADPLRVFLCCAASLGVPLDTFTEARYV
jgi:hypothetical protein